MPVALSNSKQEATVSAIERSTMRKSIWRIVPFLMICYFFAFIDRVNVGFAALQMNRDLGMTASAFGMGASIFFIAYFLFEVPSNILMEKTGARFWIARIMITWGLLSAGMALVVGPYSFYMMRFFLGAAEAGFFPGVILYLTYWFPARYRARIVAIFMIAVPVSSFIGSPLSGLLLGLDGHHSLKGWQWMFLLEGVPSVLLGVVCLFLMRDSPSKVNWLTDEEKEWLHAELAKERSTVKAVGHASVWQVLFNPYVLAGALIYGGSTGAAAGLAIWLPQILKSYGLTNLQTGLVNAIPFGVASIVMVLWGAHSDRTSERKWHTALPLMAIAASLSCIFLDPSLAVVVLIFTVAVSATSSVKGPFWALSTEWLSAKSAAVGIAQINAIGGLWSGLSTYLLGSIKESTGSYALGLAPMIFISALGSVLVLVLARRRVAGEVPKAA